MTKENTGKFCWNELATTNVKAAKDFYGQAFGWTFSEHPMGEATYTMIKRGDDAFGGIWEIPHDQRANVPPHWMSYIFVDSLDESIKKVQELGASIKVPATNAGEFGRFAIITDPAGAHIALWESC